MIFAILHVPDFGRSKPLPYHMEKTTFGRSKPLPYHMEKNTDKPKFEHFGRSKPLPYH